MTRLNRGVRRASVRVRPAGRGGFTLIEMLVVVVIIGILIALLAPAILGAVRTAREAQVMAEIQLLANSMASFKDKYGDYPPSRLILVESGIYDVNPNSSTGGSSLAAIPWLGPNDTGLPVGQMDLGDRTIKPEGYDMNYAQLAQRSLRMLRKFFPQVRFSTDTSLATPVGNYDFNGTGTLDAKPILVQGGEALAFWLGGIPNHAGGTLGMSGFGKNPANPFTNATAATTRNSPFFEFRGERLQDDDGDGIPGYVDTLGTGPDARYYAYFSSYGSNGYDPNDVNFGEQDNGGTLIGRAFRVNFGVPAPYNSTQNVVLSPAPNPYTSSNPVPAGGPPTYQNAQTYQIISAGRDRLYGVGGQYSPTNNLGKLPLDPSELSGTPPAVVTSDPAIRQREQDNLTNFASTRLD